MKLLYIISTTHKQPPTLKKKSSTSSSYFNFLSTPTPSRDLSFCPARDVEIFFKRVRRKDSFAFRRIPSIFRVFYELAKRGYPSLVTNKVVRLTNLTRVSQKESTLSSSPTSLGATEETSNFVVGKRSRKTTRKREKLLNRFIIAYQFKSFFEFSHSQAKPWGTESVFCLKTPQSPIKMPGFGKKNNIAFWPLFKLKMWAATSCRDNLKSSDHGNELCCKKKGLFRADIALLIFDISISPILANQNARFGPVWKDYVFTTF